MTITLQAPSNLAISRQEAHVLGLEAYVYLFPLVLMDLTRRNNINFAPGVKPALGPTNMLCHASTYVTVEARDVVRPNFDTLYSRAWLDLRAEPLVLSLPEMGERYYLMPLIDLWSEVFAVPGTRTSGNRPAHFAITTRDWKGELPAGVERIDAPTPFVWLLGRTQTNGPSDYAAVNAVQSRYGLVPLSRFGKPFVAPPTAIDPNFDTKVDTLALACRMNAKDFFAYAAELLKLNPPHASDWSQVARLRRLGFVVGASFDLSAAPAEVRAGLEGVPAEGLQLIKSRIPTMARVSNGWLMMTESIGTYGTSYLKRACVALAGLGANQPDDAIYPLLLKDADGDALVGEKRYVLHFEKAELPPVDAFWSVTMYDAEGFQVANPIDRYAIGDRDALKFNADGSLDILIQSDSPGPGRESNWLPAPKQGVLGVTMRLYAPHSAALDGRWNPPAVRKAR